MQWNETHQIATETLKRQISHFVGIKKNLCFDTDFICFFCKIFFIKTGILIKHKFIHPTSDDFEKNYKNKIKSFENYHQYLKGEELVKNWSHSVWYDKEQKMVYYDQHVYIVWSHSSKKYTTVP